MSDLDQSYLAAHSQAVLVEHLEMGLLQLVGKTRLTLLDRLSTQLVRTLPAGEGAATVLTTDIGRMIDRVWVYAGTNFAYCLTHEQPDNLARYFLRNVFFNDDFQLQNLSSEKVILGIYGQGASNLLRNSLGQAVDLPLYHWRELLWAGKAITLHRTNPIAGDGYWIIANRQEKEIVWNGLVNAGIFPTDLANYNYLRIEAGFPLYGHEITLDYNPLEAELWGDVSFQKGCYLGQEIIARMDSRGKVAKKLTRLRLPKAIAAKTALVTENGGAAGTITSVASGNAGILGLGYIKTSLAEVQLFVQDGADLLPISCL